MFPTISFAHRQKGADPLAEGGGHLLRGREPHSLVAPGRAAGGRSRLVEPPGGVLDEDHATAAQEEAADRSVVADVRGDPEDDDLVRVERLEERVRIRVREHVEVLLQQQYLPPALDHAPDEAGRKWKECERQRITLLGLEDLLRAARAP